MYISNYEGEMQRKLEQSPAFNRAARGLYRKKNELVERFWAALFHAAVSEGKGGVPLEPKDPRRK